MVGYLVAAGIVVLLAVVAVLYDRRQRGRALTAHDADEAARRAKGRTDALGGSPAPGPGSPGFWP